MKASPARASTLLDQTFISSRVNPKIPVANLCHSCHRRFASPELHHGPRRSPVPANDSRSQSTWSAAINAAQHYLHNGSMPQDHSKRKGSTREEEEKKQKEKKSRSLPGGVHIDDPFRLVAKEMKFLTRNMQNLLGSGHPVLDTVAKYYTQSEGKHIRPTLVLLISQAAALIPTKEGQTHTNDTASSPLPSSSKIDTPLSPTNILSDVNPSLPSSLTGNDSTTISTAASTDILPTQLRLAEITELIHTASLLHDDVLDTSTHRRSLPSANTHFGNKMAVLAGDFLLGRASVALARLRNPEVTELLATVIANLIEGEFMQLRNTALDEKNPVFSDDDTISYYLQKTYLKSASLISKSCRAAALLGGHGPDVADAAYAYGKNLGLAFQLVDDMLDFTSPPSTSTPSPSSSSPTAPSPPEEEAAENPNLGKPTNADLFLGLATAPLLFAWRSNPALGALVGRKFSEPGDVERAREMVARSDGVEQTRALAGEFVENALDALKGWPEGEAKGALRGMGRTVLERRK
ncbi:MAG: coq1 putative hexaprenyl diphosphate synthase [Alyxoria varia]|nr:MAG: coq1 putative hexaprenyl diphosphate synthase [Alyxoria varia]